MTEYRELKTVEDVNAIQGEIEEMAGSWADQNGDGRVDDWEYFLDKLENYLKIDLGSDLLSPVIKRVKAITLKVVRENAQ